MFAKPVGRRSSQAPYSLQTSHPVSHRQVVREVQRSLRRLPTQLAQNDFVKGFAVKFQANDSCFISSFVQATHFAAQPNYFQRIAAIQVRQYARVTRRQRRETATKEEERESVDLAPHDQSQVGGYQSNQQQQQQQQPYQSSSYQSAQDDVSPDSTTESLITPDVQKHLVKVYSTVGVTVGVAAVGGASSLLLAPAALGAASMIGIFGGLAALIGLMFTNPARVGLRQNLLWLFAFLEGLGLANLLAIVSPGVIVMALAGTAAIFAGFSFAALRAKNKTFLMAGGVLFGGLMICLVAGLLSVFGGFLGIPAAYLAALHNVNLYLGLAVFSVYIGYDTQAMIHDARAGNTDHVTHALNMFLNLINIFVRLLQIFREK